MSATEFLESLDSEEQNGASDSEDDLATIRDRSGNAYTEDEDLHGAYTSRMGEILGETGPDDSKSWDSGALSHIDDDEDEDEGFVYTGIDAENHVGGGYREQLEDVLDGDELDSADGAIGEGFLPPDFAQRVRDINEANEYIPVVETPASEGSKSNSTTSKSETSYVGMVSSPVVGTPLEVRPFLHPSISRLRSSLPSPQRQRVVSSSSFGTANMLDRDARTPSPSHFSSVSRTSSASNSRAIYSSPLKDDNEQEAFRWSVLRVIGEHVYNKSSDKANAVLGSPLLGSPTVLAANGLICIGTDAGRVFVFDFKQELKCICGDDNPARSFGPVTALALSHDHTFIAVGYSQGHIQLFDMKHPQVATRTVAPTTLAAVRSGRQEGHLLGSRIVSLGFISGRHTAFVSADDQGLSFYHSLGKVLFMEANDCLRLLGKYPEQELVPSPQPAKRAVVTQGNGSATPSANGSSTPHFGPRQRRRPNAILSMAPLPLGTVEHPTDLYHLVAMITPVKLVIVGLKPTPKTWFRCHREIDESSYEASRWRGCLAWFPSTSTSDTAVKPSKKSVKEGDPAPTNGTYPLLAYSWSHTMCILRVSESRVVHSVRNEKTGKVDKVDIGKVTFEDVAQLALHSDILAIQWLNHNQVILLTETTIEVYDIREARIVENVHYHSLNLMSPGPGYSSNDASAYPDVFRDIHHSVRVYKAKVFLLEYNELKVGTLLTWADRILSHVQNGDFLSAIRLARDYYLGQAKGNKNGLPEDIDAMHAMVGEKMSDLMVASVRYAFSEDRLTDSTHITPDNRGVDRTSLFEDMVSTCAQACMALDAYEFLFEDLFQHYDDSGISRIYLRRLEPFILDNSIHYIPPRITQRLVAMHDEDGDYEAAERLIWHIDPDCLDINQALTLCQKYHLYDALIYIYNSALQDYVTPIIELLGMVRKLQQIRRERISRFLESGSPGPYDAEKEDRLVSNAYKIYPYLTNILSGTRYPSETPLSPEDAHKAQTDVYSFLFYGRSRMWPSGEGGKLILTADEEGGVEPTYPYVRLFLRFDSEAFLHVLDLAFEQSYLNDEANGTSRQIIIKILPDIVSSSSPSLSPADITFVNIFIARNVPKYPQFIHIAPSSLQNLLIGLASDTDQSTREDRQLAAEFLLSAYTPHDSERILSLFEAAGFYRILRNWYRQEGNWSALLRTYIHDPDLPVDEIVPSVEETLSRARQYNGGQLPAVVLSSLQESLDHLLQGSIPQTALLIDKYVPDLHSKVINSFGEEDVHKQYAYLRCLLGPPPHPEEALSYSREGGPSTSVDVALRKLYLRLLCELEPSAVIVGLEYLPRDSLEVDEIAHICEEAKMYEAVVWLLNEDNAVTSMAKLEELSQSLVTEIGEQLLRADDSDFGPPEMDRIITKLEALYKMGIAICREDSQQTAEANVPLEDLWFRLLSSQIDAVQAISSAISSGDESSLSSGAEERVVTSLRELVQESFASLVAVSSTKAVSFPRLFKRLVDSTERPRSQSGAKYAEFRNILTGMLESYRSEGDLLEMSKRIIDSDFFDVFQDLVKARSSGWAASSSRCLYCKKRLAARSSVPHEQSPSSHASIIVSHSGVYHSACVPENVSSAP